MEQLVLDFIQGYDQIRYLWMRRGPSKTLNTLNEFLIFFTKYRIFDNVINPSAIQVADKIAVIFFFHIYDHKRIGDILCIPPRSKSFSNEDYIKAEEMKKQTIEAYIKIREFVSSVECFQVTDRIHVYTTLIDFFIYIMEK